MKSNRIYLIANRKPNPVLNHPSYIKKKPERSARWLHSGKVNVPPFPILFIVVVLVFTGVLASGLCGASDNSPEIHVGTELDFPPYASADESGNPSGFSIDLIKSVSDVMGLSIKLSTDTWDNKEIIIQRDKI